MVCIAIKINANHLTLISPAAGPTPMDGIVVSLSPILRRSIVYNNLDFGMNSVAVKWIGDSCSTLFEVQGYTFNDLENANYTSPENVIRGDSDTAEIPRSQLTTTAGEPIYYRLVAVFDNVTICSHSGTKNTFYRFDGI